MQCAMPRVACLAALSLSFVCLTSYAAPGGNGGGGNGGNNTPTTTVTADCVANPATALSTAISTISAQPQTGWTVVVNGSCTGDVELSAFDDLRFVASPAATSKPSIAGYLYVTRSSRVSVDGVDLNLASSKPFGLYCDDQSDCTLTGVTVSGAGAASAGSLGPDGVIATRRSRVSMTATNVTGFRIGLFVNSGATAGFTALNGAGDISDMKFDGIYAADGSFVSFEGGVNDAGVTTTARVSGVGRNGATLFNASLRLRQAEVAGSQTPGSAGFPVEVHSGGGVHVQRSTLFPSPGQYPTTGGGWPSIYLADLSHAFFVDGGAITLNGPIHCAGKYSAFETFGSSLVPDSIGCN